jgi:hypothetical protein
MVGRGDWKELSLGAGRPVFLVLDPIVSFLSASVQLYKRRLAAGLVRAGEPADRAAFPARA